MRNSLHHSAGFTLAELVVVLAIGSVMAGVAARSLGGLIDGWAVVAARDAVASMAHRARVEARRAGGATLRIVPDSTLVSIRSPAGSGARWSGAESGVAIEIGSGPRSDRAVELRWDALGVGRVASRTVVFRRGSTERRLVFSSTGRVRRR